MSRRAFLGAGTTALLVPSLAGCRDSGIDFFGGTAGDPRLTARPLPTTMPAILGESELDLGSSRDGLLFVPASYTPDQALPLLVMLHGAGGAAAGMRGFGLAADDYGMVVLIPESRAATWDVLRGGFGPDVTFIDRALAHTFDRCRIDTSRVALGGFSDGASYALSLGVSNGDLFTHLIAFSPGFIAPGEPIVGKPRVFVSHGTQDGILPVTQSRNRIVPDLTADGYEVRYDEFEGGHTIPSEIAGGALDWFIG